MLRNQHRVPHPFSILKWPIVWFWTRTSRCIISEHDNSGIPWITPSWYNVTTIWAEGIEYNTYHRIIWSKKQIEIRKFKEFHWLWQSEKWSTPLIDSSKVLPLGERNRYWLLSCHVFMTDWLVRSKLMRISIDTRFMIIIPVVLWW